MEVRNVLWDIRNTREREGGGEGEGAATSHREWGTREEGLKLSCLDVLD